MNVVRRVVTKFTLTKVLKICTKHCDKCFLSIGIMLIKMFRSYALTFFMCRTGLILNLWRRHYFWFREVFSTVIFWLIMNPTAFLWRSKTQFQLKCDATPHVFLYHTMWMIILFFKYFFIPWFLRFPGLPVARLSWIDESPLFIISVYTLSAKTCSRTMSFLLQIKPFKNLCGVGKLKSQFNWTHT